MRLISIYLCQFLGDKLWFVVACIVALTATPAQAGELKVVDSNSSAAALGGAVGFAPLQGGVDKLAPVQGGVDKLAPLQGGVDKQAPLQGNVDKLAPLQGSVDRLSPLQGNVDQQALHGGVDKNGGPLQGNVTGNGGTLNGMVPAYSAVMRIVQIKDKSGEVSVAPPPVTRQEIEQARFRERVDPALIPMRPDDANTRPQRGVVNRAPRDAAPEIFSRPSRALIPAPMRQKAQAVPQPEIAVSGPPVRDFGDVLERPTRGDIEPLTAPQRANVVTERIPAKPSRVDVLIPPQQNSRILQPDRIVETATIPRKSDTKLIEKEKKRNKKNRKIDLELIPHNAFAPSSPPSVAFDEKLLWDRWYAHINDMACQAIQLTMPRHRNPAGANRIKITVYPNHHLEAYIVEGSNTEFNNAILEAYRSLDGSADLQFPPGTRRQINSYETAHNQEISAQTAAFNSTLVRGDVENFVK